MITTPDNIALKEWASVCSALEAGDQILLLRKGGIHERNFGVQAPEFLLFPTYLHQKERQFKPEFFRHVQATRDRSEDDPTVTISSWCRVAAAFEVTDLERLRALEQFVIFSTDTIDERYSFRPDQAVRLIAVRTMRLPAPVEVENMKSYAGCRSWIKLREAIDLEASEAVLDDAAFATRLGEIEQALATVPS